VKTLCADASVDFVDVKVGHCQALDFLKKTKNPHRRKLVGVFFSPRVAGPGKRHFEAV
jgi:hypothetical protein